MIFRIFVFFIISIYSCEIYATPQEKETYLTTLEYIYQMGKEIYCYWNLKRETYGVNWDEIIERAKEEVTDETSRDDFKNILYRVGGSVKDGHVSYWPAQKVFDVYYVPIRFEEVEGRVVVTSIEKSHFNDDNRPEPGDEISKIDGRGVEYVLSDLEKMANGSTPEMLRRWALLWLGSRLIKPKESLDIEIIKYKTGQSLKLSIPWTIYHQSLDDLRSIKFSDLVNAVILPGNIGYLGVKSMASDKIDDYLSYIHEKIDFLLETNALIIDVRNNGGGDGVVGDAIISRLIQEDKVRNRMSLRISRPVIAKRPWLFSYFGDELNEGRPFTEWMAVKIKPLMSKRTYLGPVYVLTDEGCFSACDTFVDSFSSNKLGKVLGQPTGGGTGYPYNFTLPWNLGEFRFSTLRGYSIQGWPIEGRGTLPDYPLTKTMEDIISNKDGVLMRAHQFILEELNQPLPLNEHDHSFTLKREYILPALVINGIDFLNQQHELDTALKR